MAHQHGDSEVYTTQQPATSADAAAAKPKTRQVAARYLQPKAPAAAAVHSVAGSGPLTGRASLAGYSSTGWIELQHPNHASTPLMVPSGSTGPGVCSTSRGMGRRTHQAALPTPAAGTGQRPAVHRQAAEQQFRTPAPAGATLSGVSTAGKSVHAMDHAAAGLHSAQHCFRTPRGLSMSTAVSRPGHMTDRPGPCSADLTAAITTSSRAADSDMRAKLTKWKESKQQQQQQLSARVTARPAVFKEPAPKPTMFRATAATRTNKDPATARKPAVGPSSAPGKPPATAAAAGGRAGSGTAATGQPLPSGTMVSSPAAGSSADAAAAPLPTSSSTSPSAFTATMATLQSSSKPRSGKSSGSKAAGSRPTPVPKLRLDQGGMLSSSSPVGAGAPQAFAAITSPVGAPGSSTKIPKLNLAGLAVESAAPAAGRQPLCVHTNHTPLSSRWPSSSGLDGVVPDATPRSVRDAMPSKLPHTPGAGPPAASAQQAPRWNTALDDDDHVARQLDTNKPAAEQLSSGSAAAAGDGCGKPVVPKLKLGAMLAGKMPTPDKAAAANYSRPAAGISCLSARLPGGAARGSLHAGGQAAQLPGPPAGRHNSSSDGGAASTPGATYQRGKTPRVSGAAAARLLTPRSLSASMTAAAVGPAAAAAGPVPAAGPALKRGQVDRAEQTRQELRLLRMQQLQLRHLNARMEAASKAKAERVNAAVAAAATAVVDLSGRLLQLKHKAQQSTWHSQLELVLEQQQTRLQSWMAAQAEHVRNISQLQTACSSALSHVPLLNGATIGHDPDQPDLQALQRQLQHGMHLLGELQPAVQLLMTGNAAAPSSSYGAVERVGVSSPAQPCVQDHLHPRGIKDTAALAQDLMTVADEECQLLQSLTQQLSELSDLQLYVNSMQVQLQGLKEPIGGAVGAPADVVC